MIKLRCVQAPHKGGLFTVGKVYADAKFSLVDKFGSGGVLKAKNNNGRFELASYRITPLKQVWFKGYVFRVLLVAGVQSA